MLAVTPAAVLLVLVGGMSFTVRAATLLSERWTAGGLSAGTDSVGQAALPWRVDPSVGLFPTVGRLLVDADGSAIWP